MEDTDFSVRPTPGSGGQLVERLWLADRVDVELSRDAVRILLLTGAPGWGKTTFAAMLARERPTMLPYFIREDSRQLLHLGSARAFLTAVGHRLAAARPELFSPDLDEIGRASCRER